ncbi:MAG TPA: hypothetical protein VKV02_02920 [Acidobacteriaceae bacterium]|nr:hypothetical protein [Acidobacteriaceae bacterium]
MSWFQPLQNSAAERYQRRSFVCLMFFAAALLGMRWLRSAQGAAVHLSAPALFGVAGAFALPLAGVAIALGMYLNEEQDEFQRNIEVRGLLAGAAALLLVSVFFSFLHQLKWTGYVDPVAQVMTFGLVNGAVKLACRFRARVDGE